MLAANVPSADGLTLYHLAQPAHIGAVLQALHQTQGVLSLFPIPQEGVDAQEGAPAAPAQPLAMAQIHACDAFARTLTVRLQGTLQEVPERLQAVAHMAGGVRVQFMLQGQWQTTQAHTQLHMAWPAQVQQLQRRRHPRLSVPLGQSHTVRFQFGRRWCELDLDDLSIAGLALRGTRQETAMLFLGRKLTQVQLFIGEEVQLQADLQVRSRRSYQSFLLGEQVLVGCSVEAMADADQQRLQDWLAQVQPAL